MSFREELQDKFIIDGRPYTLRLIENPLIDDVLITQAQIVASERWTGEVVDSRVKRNIRDYLIRLSVER